MRNWYRINKMPECAVFLYFDSLSMQSILNTRVLCSLALWCMFVCVSISMHLFCMCARLSVYTHLLRLLEFNHIHTNTSFSSSFDTFGFGGEIDLVANVAEPIYRAL